MKEFLTIGDKNLLASLGVWGLLALVILSIILAIVASVSGNDRGSSF
jgi:hypothetical protein